MYFSSLYEKDLYTIVVRIAKLSNIYIASDLLSNSLAIIKPKILQKAWLFSFLIAMGNIKHLGIKISYTRNFSLLFQIRTFLQNVLNSKIHANLLKVKLPSSDPAPIQINSNQWLGKPESLLPGSVLVGFY